jgi:hypothetical protein
MTQRTTLAAQWRSILLAIFAISLFACSGGNDDDNSDATSNSLLLNFTSDYTTGVLRWMDTDSESLSTGSIDFEQDSKVIAHNGQIFVLERYNGGADGNLSCFNPSTINDPTTIVQHKLHGGNPYDIAFVGNIGYIVFHSSDELETFNVNTCALGDRIPLPGNYASGISLSANAASINASGDTLLVILQRLEDWSATNPGLLVRMKTDGSLIDTIRLNFYNPNSAILNDGKLYIASTNDPYGTLDLNISGIEVVDLNGGISEILVDGNKLGSGVNGIALDEESQILYVGAYASWGNAPVKPINLSDKSVSPALPSIVDASGGLVFDNVGKKLYAGDRDFTNPGLKIYNPATGETTLASNQALPPYSLDRVRW